MDFIPLTHAVVQSSLLTVVFPRPRKIANRKDRQQFILKHIGILLLCHCRQQYIKIILAKYCFFLFGNLFILIN